MKKEQYYLGQVGKGKVTHLAVMYGDMKAGALCNDKLNVTLDLSTNVKDVSCKSCTVYMRRLTTGFGAAENKKRLTKKAISATHDSLIDAAAAEEKKRRVCNDCEHKRAMSNKKKGVKIPGKARGKCTRSGGLCEHVAPPTMTTCDVCKQDSRIEDTTDVDGQTVCAICYVLEQDAKDQPPPDDGDPLTVEMTQDDTRAMATQTATGLNSERWTPLEDYEFPRAEVRKVYFAIKEDPGNLEDLVGSLKHKALVNEETEKCYAILSDKYSLVQHEDAYEALLKAVRANPEYGQPTSRVRHHDEGRLIRIELTFEDVTVEIAPGDEVSPSLNLFNAYDGTRALMVMLGAFRYICSNGQVMGISAYKAKVVHMGSAEERLPEIALELEDAMHKFSAETEIWKRWADEECSFAHLEDGVAAFFNKRTNIVKAVDEHIEEHDRLTVWDFYNIMTALITHKIKSLTQAQRIERNVARTVRHW